MIWRQNPSDPACEELVDDLGRVVAAFGPNPYGMMGQDYTRGWVFDPVTTQQVGTSVWAPYTQKTKIREDLERMVRS